MTEESSQGAPGFFVRKQIAVRPPALVDPAADSYLGDVNRQRDDDVVLDRFLSAVQQSSKARTRWESLTSEQLRPLVDWVCLPRWRWMRLHRIPEAVRVLERPPSVPVGPGITDMLFPPVDGPSPFDLFSR